MAMLQNTTIANRSALVDLLQSDYTMAKAEIVAGLSEGNFAAWQAQAVETYRQSKSDVERALRAALAGRLTALIGREVPAHFVYADPDKPTARVTVDGTSFRLTEGRLVLLIPCSFCGVREFESPAIETPLDLGYALSVWKPYCRDCAPEDVEEWE